MVFALDPERVGLEVPGANGQWVLFPLPRRARISLVIVGGWYGSNSSKASIKLVMEAMLVTDRECKAGKNRRGVR